MHRMEINHTAKPTIPILFEKNRYNRTQYSLYKNHSHSMYFIILLFIILYCIEEDAKIEIEMICR